MFTLKEKKFGESERMNLKKFNIKLIIVYLSGFESEYE